MYTLHMMTIVVQTHFLTVQTQFPMYWSEKKKVYKCFQLPEPQEICMFNIF